MIIVTLLLASLKVGAAGTPLAEASVVLAAVGACLFPSSETKSGESGSLDNNIGSLLFLGNLWTVLDRSLFQAGDKIWRLSKAIDDYALVPVYKLHA